MATKKPKQIQINPEDDIHQTFKLKEIIFIIENLPNMKKALQFRQARTIMDKCQSALAAYTDEQKQKQERDNESKNVDRCNSVADAAASVVES